MDDIHSCSYYCDRPACIKAQRDLLREKLVSHEWVVLTDDEIDHIWGITKPDYEDKFDFARAIEAKFLEKNT